METEQKKEVIPGVNSTFLANHHPLRSDLTTSLPPLCDLEESSDSGEGTICRSSAPSEVSIPVVVNPPSIIVNKQESTEMPLSSESFDVKPRTEDRLCHLVKELVMNERTNERDLGILMKLRDILHNQESSRIIEETFKLFGDLRGLIKEFLVEMEKRIAPWSGGEGISELLLRLSHNMINAYTRLVDRLPMHLAALDQLALNHQHIASIIKKVEASDECYIGITWLTIRVANALCSWPPVIAGFIEQYLADGREEDSSVSAARITLEKVSKFLDDTAKARESLNSYVVLLQLEADLAMPGTFTHPHRRLLRVGRVERWTRRGLVSRLLLLFNDTLMFAFRVHSQEGAPTFRVHLQLPLRGMLFEEGDSVAVTGRPEQCITLYSHDICVVFATSARDDWLENIGEAVKAAARNRMELPSMNIAKQTEEEEEKAEEDAAHRMSPIHVCWHRTGTIGYNDWMKMIRQFKSGYLLRKLRNSPGWQKLWVILGNFSLFFYKSHQEPAPIANLPLLEYSVSIPSLTDNITQENVFKLTYSTHQYFFRAENRYSMLRWMECIRKCTTSRQGIDAMTALALHL